MGKFCFHRRSMIRLPFITFTIVFKVFFVMLMVIHSFCNAAHIRSYISLNFIACHYFFVYFHILLQCFPNIFIYFSLLHSFHNFSLISNHFIAFHRCSTIFITHSIILIAFHNLFNGLHSFSLLCHWFSMSFVEYKSLLLGCGKRAMLRKPCL